MAEVAVEVICKAIWENAKLSRARHSDWKSEGHHIHFLELNRALEPDIYLEVPGCSENPNHNTIVESESYQVVLLNYPNRIFIGSVMSKLKPKNWRRSQERGRIARLGRVGPSSVQTCTADVPAPSYSVILSNLYSDFLKVLLSFKQQLLWMLEITGRLPVNVLRYATLCYYVNG